MDYSLYIKIETQKSNKDSLLGHWDRIGLARNKFQSVNSKEIYHIGIIDYLQEWTFEKKFENKVKKILTQS